MQATDAARGTIRSPAAVAKAARRAVRARTSVPVSYQPDRWAIRGADPTAITAVRNVAREGR